MPDPSASSSARAPTTRHVTTWPSVSSIGRTQSAMAPSAPTIPYSRATSRPAASSAAAEIMRAIWESSSHEYSEKALGAGTPVPAGSAAVAAGSACRPLALSLPVATSQNARAQPATKRAETASAT